MIQQTVVICLAVSGAGGGSETVAISYHVRKGHRKAVALWAFGVKGVSVPCVCARGGINVQPLRTRGIAANLHIFACLRLGNGIQQRYGFHHTGALYRLKIKRHSGRSQNAHNEYHN